MRKWCAILLTLVLMLPLLCGCSPSAEGLLQGQWKAKVDLASAYEELLARSDASVAAHIDLSEFDVEVTITFDQEGKYIITADQEALSIGAAKMELSIRSGLASYLQSQTGKTMDNLLTATGMNFDDLMKNSFGSDLAGTIEGSLESEGTYKVSGSKLILKQTDGKKLFEGKFSVDEERLELTSGVTTDLISSLLPLQLKKK